MRRCSTWATGTSSWWRRPDRRAGWPSSWTGGAPGFTMWPYRVQDIESTLRELSAAGVRLIDEQPRVGIRGSRVAFVHPSSTGGVLTEIVQPAEGSH